MLLNSRQQRLRVRAHNLADLLAVLEHDEGGHGADVELLRYIGYFVDVDLDEMCAGVFFREPVSLLVSVFRRMVFGGNGMEGRDGNVLGDSRSNDLARTAPGCKRVEDHNFVVFEGGVELGFAVGREGLALFSYRVPLQPISIPPPMQEKM